MLSVKTEQASEITTKIQVENISYLSFITLINYYPLLTYSIFDKKKDLFYQEEEIKTNNIQTRLRQIFLKTKDESILPLSQLIDCTLYVKRKMLHEFIQRLNQDKNPELHQLAKKLNQGVSKTNEHSIKVENELLNIETDDKHEKQESIQLLAIDHSFENKLIFYHFFRKNNNSTEAITNRTELLTMEQKEKFWEQLCEKKINYTLPSIITTHPFCTLEIVDQLYNLLTIIEATNIKFCLQALTTTHGFITPLSIINSGEQESYLTICEEIKKQFSEAKNALIIPKTFKQRAIFNLDLPSFLVISKHNTPLSTTITEKVITQFHFLQYLTNFK